MNAGFLGNLTGPGEGQVQSVGIGLEKAADRFPAVPGSAAELVDQFGCGPGRLTTRVPFGQNTKSLFVVEREAPPQPAADAEGVNISMLSRNGRRHRRQVPLRTLNSIQILRTQFFRVNR